MFKLKHIRKNTEGRDFIIGDLHGCFNDLILALKALNFNPEVDRVLSVGDLVDRGPHSFACLELLDFPWFHAVRGNHEDLMLNGLNHGSDSWSHWMQNGGMWFNGLDDSEKFLLHTNGGLLDKANALPHVLVVGGEFLILHAECLSRGPGLTLELLEAQLDELGQPPSMFQEPQLTWGRRLFRRWFNDPQAPEDLNDDREEVLKLLNGSQLPPTFVGHTVMNHPLKIGPFHNLDTGAVFASEQKPWRCLSIQEWMGPLWQWRENKLVQTTWNAVV